VRKKSLPLTVRQRHSFTWQMPRSWFDIRTGMQRIERGSGSGAAALRCVAFSE